MIPGGIALAIACWAFTFGWPGGNFWVKIGLSVAAVSVYSLCWERPDISVRPLSILLGLLSAAALYGIFYVGYRLAPLFVAQAHTQVGGIYSLGEGTNRWLIFLLLLIVTGPGEEIFWRGFLQDRLMKLRGDLAGTIIATAIYSGVHVFSWNPVLILAALVAGAFWGLLYLWRRDLCAQIVSHSVWSAVIFAVAPIQ
ncbi:MAG TPA: CPBP family intramembrane glutamic endopeptidase [Thermodesulfobacteriota bacterium]|nr:CPBP family intramembrane glutamic endopeptidase [Thermodesulfobacteriota bacterium]